VVSPLKYLVEITAWGSIMAQLGQRVSLLRNKNAFSPGSCPCLKVYKRKLDKRIFLDGQIGRSARRREAVRHHVLIMLTLRAQSYVHVTGSYGERGV